MCVCGMMVVLVVGLFLCEECFGCFGVVGSVINGCYVVGWFRVCCV